MVTKTLSPEALDELKRFIRSRGFTDPAVVACILDHFACKVEEQLMLHPEWSLQQAMEQAHKAFGIRGFAPLQQSLEQELIHRYRRQFRQELRHQITSLRLLPIWLGSGLLVFYLYLLADRQQWLNVLDNSDLVWGLYLLVLLLYTAWLYRLRLLSGKPHIHSRAALGYTNLVPFFIVCFLAPAMNDIPVQAGWKGLIMAVFMVTLLIGARARIQVMRQADADHEQLAAGA